MRVTGSEGITEEGRSPDLSEHGKTPFRISGARGGQGVEREVGAREQLLVVAAETLIGVRAVEAAGADRRIRSEQHREIVAAFRVDGRVEAAGALAARDRVPEGDVMGKQKSFAQSIIFLQFAGKKGIDHGPKIVAGIAIIHGFFQR